MSKPSIAAELLRRNLEQMDPVQAESLRNICKMGNPGLLQMIGTPRKPPPSNGLTAIQRASLERLGRMIKRPADFDLPDDF